MDKLTSIKISGDILEDMFVSKYNYDKIGTFVDPNGKFTGWHIEADYESGSYESSKSSMVDFEINLFRPWIEGDAEEFEDESICVATAVGGYYNEISGYSFNDLTFYPLEPETPNSKFRNFLSEIINEEIGLDKMINKIENEIKKIRQ